MNYKDCSMKLNEVYTLLEARNYEDMFSKIFAMLEQYGTEDAKKKYNDEIKKSLKEAKQDFKKDDRITWYLRIVKYNVLKEFIRFNFIPDDVKEQIRKEMKKIEQKGNFSRPADTNEHQIYQELTHFLSLEKVKKIQDYTFTNQSWSQIKSEFEEYEQEWQDSLVNNGVEIQDGDKVLLKFDGGQKAWWLLERGSCRDEANMMGHCGNQPSEKPGDRILSFRTATDDPNIWVPHLTFILDDDGMLGEMKGRSNKKPQPKYHPYIIELLEHSIVEGVKGGGHDPANNFSINDLDDDKKEELLSDNPKLASLYDIYKSEGISKRVKYRICDELDKKRLPEIYDINDKEVILHQFNDLEDFLEETFRDINRTTRNIYDMMFEDVDDDISEEELKDHANDLKVSDEIYIRIIEKLSDRTLDKIAKELDIDFDYSSIQDRTTMAEMIDNTEHGEIIRTSIMETLYKGRKTVKEEDGYDEFVEDVILLVQRALHNHQASIESSESETYSVVMNTDDFIRMISGDPDDEYDEDISIIIEAVNRDSWASLDEYNLEEDMKNPEYALDSHKNFERFVNLAKMDYEFLKKDDIKSINFDDVANIVEREMVMKDSEDMSRLRMLAGI